MVLVTFTVLFGLSGQVHAEQEGDFTYTITNGEAQVTGYNWVGGDVTIPDTLGGVPVTSIGEQAFYWGPNWWPDKSDIIKSIHIPASVTYIGNNAFANNSGLKSINLPQGIRKIDDYTFYGCKSLTAIDIPQSVECIGNYAFRGCACLSNISIPMNTTRIGDYAFDNCGGLANILIPQNISSIGFAAFSSCYSISEFVVDENNLAFTSRDGVLYDKPGTTLVAWPWRRTEISIPQGVTAIGDGVFLCMTGLTNINIPEGVTRIGTGAFQGCTELKNISLPQSLKSIDEIAFGSCRGLTNIDLPKSLSNIGINAFSGTGLKDLTIPESVTSIGSGAFSSCESLTNVKLPEGLSCIGESTFYQCKNLTEINIPESVTIIGVSAFNNCNSLKTISVPKNVTNIESWTFNGCWKLTNITLPEGLLNIGNNAFNQCYELSKIELPSTLITIGEGAFSQCSGLTQIIIPEKVQTVGIMAFEWCSNLKSIRFNSSETQILVAWQSWFVTIPTWVTIIGYNSSHAKDYADKYKNPFQPIDNRTTIDKETKIITVQALSNSSYELASVPDARVYVYEKDNIPMCIGKESDDNKILFTGKTDDAGKCTLTPPTGGWPDSATVVACKNEIFENEGRPLARESYDNIVFTLQAHSLTIGESGEWYGKKIKSLSGNTELVLDSPRYLCNLSIMYYYSDKTGDYYDDVAKMTVDLSKQLSKSTDGYFAINNIAIYGTTNQNDFKTNGSRASQCDIQINDSSRTWSNSQIAGFYDDTKMDYYRNLILKNKLGESKSIIITDDGIKSNYRVEMSKENVWAKDISDSYNYSKEVLHELGHYILDCYDEYKDGNKNDWTFWYHPNDWANFGLMENEYNNIELSNDSKYLYLLPENKADKSKLTWQYVNNDGSCWNTLANKFPYIVLRGDNSVESQSDVISSITQQYYFFHIHEPSKERTYDHYDTNETISSEVALPTYSISEEFQRSNELIANIKVITQPAGDQVVISPIKGTPASLTQMFYDDTASVEIPLIAEGTTFTGTIPVQKERYYLRLVTTQDNNETCYSDFVVRSTKDTLQSSYISDDGSVCVSINSATTDSYNFVSQDGFISREGYVPLAKVVYITSKDKATVNDSILVSDVGSSMLVDTSTIAWYKFENDQWIPLETQKQDGDYNSIIAYCSIDGEGYYQLMAQPAKTTSTFQPVQGLTITANNQYDGSANIDFTDNNNKDAIWYYKFYYSDQPFSTADLNTASVQMFDTYGSSYSYTFEDNAKTYYGAIQIVGKDGSVSDLSEVKSFTTGIRDTDNDSIPDAWIEQYSLRTPENQDTAIAGLDNDADGLTNQQEYQYGTNPQRKDTDDDGVVDSDELGKGLNPLQVMTDGSTPDYIAAYGSNDFTVENCQMSSENGIHRLSISVKNLSNTPAKDVNVKLLFDGNVEWFWQADFEAGKTTDLSYVFDGDIPTNIQVSIDNEQKRYDINYSNNLYSLSNSPTESTLESIAISNPANKLNYMVGDSLDITGLTVTGIYSNGSTKTETITADNITGFNSSAPATDQVLTITVNGKTATFAIQITDQIDQMLGDVDNNGKVEAYDALLALQIATGKKTGTPAEIIAADVDKSGSVQAYDALRILQYVTGVISAF